MATPPPPAETSGDATSEDAELAAYEEARRALVVSARSYYSGTQFDVRNETRAKALDTTVPNLPEHERLHAYSTQIQEAVDFIAQQMADSFSLEAANEEVTGILMTALRRSPELEGGQDEVDVSLTNVLRDSMIAMDTPVWVRWDPIEGTPWADFWPSEDVEMRYDPRDARKLIEVRVQQPMWTGEGDKAKKRVLHTHWKLNETGACIRELHFDEEKVHETVEEGLPFIPWVSLRAQKKSSKSLRGESLITPQMQRMADRFNANEQIAYLIARYNSHGNLAVIGDAASLKVELDERINKDVADILSFPGGTALQVLQLPTDPQMIMHQREVLLDGMYGGFGLSRLDHTTLQSMGQVTGYALEIMNRKSDGTFNQVKNRYLGDFRRLLNMILDVVAYLGGEELEEGMEREEPAEILEGEADPALDRFPDRTFKISLGSGGVIDEVQIRDDYTAGLISRAEANRRRGTDPDTIKRIDDEIEEEKPKEPETGVSAKAAGEAAALIVGAKEAPASSVKTGGVAKTASTRGK